MTKTHIASFVGAIIASIHAFSFALVTSPLAILNA